MMLILTMIATPAVAADQFDLECVGTKSEKIDQQGEPISFGIVVDLRAKQFCWKQECEVKTIDEVLPDRVYFLKHDPTDREIFSKMEIDRKTGKFEWLIIQKNLSRYYLKQEAVCTPAKFTGFPATKF
ncbi:hypothetical protein OSJ57_17570 [Sphingomonas sp. HH69]